MDSSELFAVITGDVTGSSRFSGEQRKILLERLYSSFDLAVKVAGPENVLFPFQIYRGDGFQAVLKAPENSLKTAIALRAALRGLFFDLTYQKMDARIAVGIGTIDLMPQRHGGEGDGQAFRNSGPYLDNMTEKSSYLSVVTPWENVNKELEVECVLLDILIRKWTPSQAKTLLYNFLGFTQQQIADQLKISQPAVNKKLSAVHIHAVDIVLRRFKELVESGRDNKKIL